MTSGRAVVLGDIGPWACAGQTGGRVYMRINDEWGLDREALERRLGKGAMVALHELDAEGVADVKELLGHYAQRARALRAARRGASASARIAAERRPALPDVGAASASRPTRRFRRSRPSRSGRLPVSQAADRVWSVRKPRAGSAERVPRDAARRFGRC